MRGNSPLRQTILRWAAIICLAPVVLFALGAWAGSSIARNGNWRPPDPATERTIAIMVGTNGIHTEIAMPLVSAEMDWRRVFPARDIAAGERPYTHVAVSWGERAFFLETPSWSDLSIVTAANALIGGQGVLHVAHYVRPAPADDYRVLHIRASEYRALAQQITAQLKPEPAREVMTGYGQHDVFYSADGSYHLGNTCNQWTSDQLARAGIVTGSWTPLSGGVMKWVPQSQSMASKPAD
jgi:uncharacterized protein (TIGR02117 family)